MKNSILVLFLLTFLVNIFSQDLIITDKDDSLNCRITKVIEENIYFSFNYIDRIRNTMMPLDRVKIYKYGYFNNDKTSVREIAGYHGYKKIRTAVNFGWSYRTAPVEEGLQSLIERYFKELKKGYHISSDLNYFFTEYFGFGLKYSFYKSSNELSNVQVTFEGGSQKTGKIRDDITIHFIGPSFNMRLLPGDGRNTLHSGFSAGYVRYINNSQVIDKYIVKGETLGFSWDVGCDLGLSANVYLGLMFSYTLGVLKEYEVDDGTYRVIYELDTEDYDNLSRIDLSVGLRIDLLEN